MLLDNTQKLTPITFKPIIIILQSDELNGQAFECGVMPGPTRQKIAYEII